MEDWVRAWRDKTTEPYTVLHIEQRSPNAVARWGRELWTVYYRSYAKRSSVVVEAKDELGAYMKALKRIKTNKHKTDQLNKKKEQTNEHF
jgi:hypothetical protein